MLIPTIVSLSIKEEESNSDLIKEVLILKVETMSGRLQIRFLLSTTLEINCQAKWREVLQQS